MGRVQAKKGWKSVVEHLLSKWSSIDDIDKRLQLFLLKEGEPPSTTVNFNHDYFFEEAVEAVLMRDAGFRSVLMTPNLKIADVVPLVMFSYAINNIEPPAIAPNASTSEASLPPGFTVMDDSWMQAFSLMNHPAPSTNTGNTESRAKPPATSNESDHFSMLKRYDASLPGFSASVLGRFASGASHLINPSHSLLGGVLPAEKSSSEAKHPPEKSATSSSSRIYESVERAIISASPSAVPSTASEGLSQQLSPSSSNLSLLSSGGEDGSNMSINMLKVRYKKKPKREEKVEEKAAAAAVRLASPIKPLRVPEPAPVEVAPVPAAEIEPAPVVLSTPPSSPGILSPMSDRKRKRVRFERENESALTQSLASLVSPSKFSPIAKATVRSVSKGHVYLPAHSSTLVEPKFMPTLNRRGRSRPELRRIKPTFIRPLSVTDE
jgi:hypothetical protein